MLFVLGLMYSQYLVLNWTMLQILEPFVPCIIRFFFLWPTSSSWCLSYLKFKKFLYFLKLSLTSDVWHPESYLPFHICLHWMNASIFTPRAENCCKIQILSFSIIETSYRIWFYWQYDKIAIVWWCRLLICIFVIKDHLSCFYALRDTMRFTYVRIKIQHF